MARLLLLMAGLGADGVVVPQIWRSELEGPAPVVPLATLRHFSAMFDLFEDIQGQERLADLIRLLPRLPEQPQAILTLDQLRGPACSCAQAPWGCPEMRGGIAQPGYDPHPGQAGAAMAEAGPWHEEHGRGSGGA